MRSVFDFDFSRVNEVFTASRSKYLAAEPFAHISFDGLFDPSLLTEVASEFPSAEQMSGAFKVEIQGGKFTESDWSRFGPATQAFVAACNSGPFLHALAALTGIEGLISDPYLAGGGQHQTGSGGRLKVHSDFNVHPFLNLTRRLNMLVYLNDGWKQDWGGSLELWNKDMSRSVVQIPPTMGKVAIFSTTDESFHGLPDPITPPEGVYRRSIAFYYFTADASMPEARSTLWKERPNENFLNRPEARLKKSAGHLRQAIKSLIP